MTATEKSGALCIESRVLHHPVYYFTSSSDAVSFSEIVSIMFSARESFELPENLQWGSSVT
jgi:hypothetical protein